MSTARPGSALATYQNLDTYKSSMSSPKQMLAPSDYAVWLLGVLIQLIGMIVLTFHGPKGGESGRSETTFLFAGWGVFTVGTIIILVKIFMLRK